MRDKIDLLEYCVKGKINVISCTGAGRRFDATKIKIGDISDPIIDPLAKKMRRELRKRGIEKGIPVIYSEEQAVDMKKGQSLPSCCFATGAVGLAAAGYVCKKLAGINRE